MGSNKSLYYLVREDIRKKINNKIYKTNDKLPSEDNLAKDYNVSKLTVRNALTTLVNEGLITRYQGRGTFVTGLSLENKPARIASFFIEMQRDGYKPTSIILEFKISKSNNSISRHLGIRDNDPVVKLKRIRLIDGEPVLLQENYIPENLCPGILNENLESSALTELLESKYRFKQNYAIEKMKAIVADNESVKFLNYKKGLPILYVEGVYYHDDKPLQLVYKKFRGDRYTYVASLFSKAQDNIKS